jgi:hypothetical protein
MSLTGPIAVASITSTAINYRQFMRSLVPRSGVDAAGAMLVKQRASPGQGVLVSAGGIFVLGNSSGVQGVYYDYNDADLDVPASAADGAQTRVDRIIYQIQDPDFVGGTPPGSFAWVNGTPGSATPPAVPADSMSLAQVARAINGNTLTSGMFTDERVFASSLGGSVQGWTQAGRPTVGAYVKGQHGFDVNGAEWLCTAGGTPGTWMYIAGGPYHAHLYRTASLAVDARSVPVVIPLDTADFDPGAGLSGGVYHCPVTGIYHIDWSVEVAVNMTFLSAVHQAGSRAVTYQASSVLNASGNLPVSSGSSLVNAVAGDTFALYAQYGSLSSTLWSTSDIGSNRLSVKLVA